jgi:hypothetical protein
MEVLVIECKSTKFFAIKENYQKNVSLSNLIIVFMRGFYEPFTALPA